MSPRASLRLVKAHAYGNDFLLVPASSVPRSVDPAGLARRLCDRHRAIGADGLIVVDETPSGARTDLFNADGSPSEVSGNGVRCVGAWLAERRGLGAGATLLIATGAGDRQLSLLAAEGARYRFRAAMGPPTELREERIQVGEECVTAAVMRVGNPQCVVLGPVSEARLQQIGGALAAHPFFPAGTNVELAEVDAPGRVRILIWERGVGPTLASGTGACAAAVAAAAFGGADRTVEVTSPGGTQQVEWTDAGLWLTGWAEVIADVDWRAT